jgi:hypothetical protein
LVSPTNHSTNFSIIIITRGWHNRPIGGRSGEWTQLDSTPPLYQFKKNTLSPADTPVWGCVLQMGRCAVSIRFCRVKRSCVQVCVWTLWMWNAANRPPQSGYSWYTSSCKMQQ